MTTLKEFNDIFDGLFENTFGQSSRGQYELVEDQVSPTLYVLVPGYKAENLTVEMREGLLTIIGQKDDRATRLIPNKIDLKFTISRQIIVESAEFEDGVLKIKINRQSNKVEAVKIPILSN